MSLAIWIPAFIVSLAILIYAADLFTKGAEILGLRLRINPFIIGVTIVSIGTSLPELVTSLLSISRGHLEIVAANAVGSNIANILLIVGLGAAIAGPLVVRRSLIDLDAPLLAISTAIVLVTLFDGTVSRLEALILLVTYGVYLAYTIITGQNPDDEIEHKDKKIKKIVKERVDTDQPDKVDYSWYRITLLLIVGAIGVYFGADYTITSVVNIGTIIGIPAAAIAITAIALGTSLPELVVSVAAARKGSFEIALGNVFGSNIFNALVVIGLPALIIPIPVDPATLGVGLVFLILATLLYIFSGISKAIHRWEGLMYMLLYVLFVMKIFAGSL